MLRPSQAAAAGPRRRLHPQPRIGFVLALPFGKGAAGREMGEGP